MNKRLLTKPIKWSYPNDMQYKVFIKIMLLVTFIGSCCGYYGFLYSNQYAIKEEIHIYDSSGSSISNFSITGLRAIKVIEEDVYGYNGSQPVNPYYKICKSFFNCYQGDLFLERVNPSTSKNPMFDLSSESGSIYWHLYRLEVLIESQTTSNEYLTTANWSFNPSTLWNVVTTERQGYPIYAKYQYKEPASNCEIMTPLSIDVGRGEFIPGVAVTDAGEAYLIKLRESTYPGAESIYYTEMIIYKVVNFELEVEYQYNLSDDFSINQPEVLLGYCSDQMVFRCKENQIVLFDLNGATANIIIDSINATYFNWNSSENLLLAWSSSGEFEVWDETGTSILTINLDFSEINTIKDAIFYDNQLVLYVEVFE